MRLLNLQAILFPINLTVILKYIPYKNLKTKITTMTNTYIKIQTVWLRDKATNFKTLLENAWAKEEFLVLKNNEWIGTEKIDGTNIRVIWDGKTVSFKGKTDKADIPKHLQTKLITLFTKEKLQKVFPPETIKEPICLYGEGYGYKIQRGENYILKDTNFILFDIKIGNYWLARDNIKDIANKLAIDIVPIVFKGTLLEAIEKVRIGFKSTMAQNKDYIAEGLVLKPSIELYNRKGERIITKIKHKDF